MTTQKLVLKPSAFKVYKDQSRFRVLASGRRFGKTRLAASEMLKFATRKKGAIVWYLAPSYRMAARLMWSILKSIIPDDLDEVVTSISINLSVGEINNLLKQDGDSFENVISNQAKRQLMSLQGGYDLEPRVIFKRSQLLGITSKLRNIILNWSLQLEEDGILGKGLKFSDKEKEALSKILT